MAEIRLSRGGGYADALRAYVVTIDGEFRGHIKRHETQTFDMPPGLHDIQLRIDAYTSPKVDFELTEAGATFACKPNSHPLFALFNLVLKPRTWIALERVDGV